MVDCPSSGMKKKKTVLLRANQGTNRPFQVYHMANRKPLTATTPCKPQPSRKIFKRFWGSSKRELFWGCSTPSTPAPRGLYIILHYITLYYITLHYIILHYITLHYITLYYITLHYIILHYITLHYIILHYITLHYITLHYITLHYITLHYIILHYVTLYYITLHYIILRYIKLHYITLHYITLYYITLHDMTYSIPWCVRHVRSKNSFLANVKELYS